MATAKTLGNAWRQRHDSQNAKEQHQDEGRGYIVEKFLFMYLFVQFMYISVRGHQQVATSSHKLYICLMWTINNDTLIIMTIRMMMMTLDLLAGMWWLAEEEVYS